MEKISNRNAILFLKYLNYTADIEVIIIYFPLDYYKMYIIRFHEENNEKS